MKEISRLFTDRLGYASLAFGLLLGALSATDLISGIFDAGYTLGIGLTLFILGSTLLLQPRLSKRLSNIIAAVSFALVLVSLAVAFLFFEQLLPIAIPVMGVASIFFIVSSLSSATSHIATTTLEQRQLFIIGTFVLGLVVVYIASVLDIISIATVTLYFYIGLFVSVGVIALMGLKKQKRNKTETQ